MYTRFRLVPKSMTLGDLKGNNSLCYIMRVDKTTLYNTSRETLTQYSKTPDFWLIDYTFRIAVATFRPLWLINVKKCRKVICVFVIAGGVAGWLVSFRFLSDIRFRFNSGRDVHVASSRWCVTTPGSWWLMSWMARRHRRLYITARPTATFEHLYSPPTVEKNKQNEHYQYNNCILKFKWRSDNIHCSSKSVSIKKICRNVSITIQKAVSRLLKHVWQSLNSLILSILLVLKVLFKNG